MNNNSNGDFTETDGSNYSYEVLAQPPHLLPGGVDKTKREVLHHILLTTHDGRTLEISGNMDLGLNKQIAFFLTALLIKRGVFLGIRHGEDRVRVSTKMETSPA